MSEKDLLNIRTALIVSLSVLALLILWRRLRQPTALDPPPPPARLRVEKKAPAQPVAAARLLDHAHEPLHTWVEEPVQRGEHTLERALPPLTDGVYFLEMATATQRTLRQFRLQQA